MLLQATGGRSLRAETISGGTVPATRVARANTHAAWLWALLGLFVVRVVAQPLARLTGWGFLPAFEAWQSGALPYAWLVAAQAALLVWMTRTAARVTSGADLPRPWAGRVLAVAAGLYALAMSARLVAGLTWKRGHWWLDAPLPTLFHLVLAGYLGVYANYHVRAAAPAGTSSVNGLRRLAPWVIYPATMTAAYSLFALMQACGASLVLSLYAPILMTAVTITVLERVLPYRREWQPAAGEVATDVSFMVLVQMALPPVVSLLAALALAQPVRALALPVQTWWPHQLPVWAQTALMVLAVDLLRYWLHRFAHENATLWRLHAVHHSVTQLYWLNTSRFHPIEKGLQMCLDSLPFVLLGVHPQVLALYYLSYAANGFFQHCNVELRYGALNYLVGSAETHRWHHSREPHESNANYGNTVIVWDLLFGTWFLPKDREIAALGPKDPTYPTSFLPLLAAPFRQ